MEFIKIDEYSKSLENLGFYKRELLKFEITPKKSKERILYELLKSDLYFKSEQILEYKKEGTKKYKLYRKGPFVNNLNISDFNFLTFKNLKSTIKSFELEEGWGEDLPVFKKLNSEIFEYIISNEFDDEDLFYVNKDLLSKEKKVEFDDYSYYLSIIFISISKKQVLIITLGGD